MVKSTLNKLSGLKKTKLTLATRMSMAADIADLAAGGCWEDEDIKLLGEQFLELRDEYVRLHSRYFFPDALSD